jgi:diguanylate cyclase
MTSFPSNLDYEAFRNVVEALVESGQAVSIFDADENLR